MAKRKYGRGKSTRRSYKRRYPVIRRRRVLRRRGHGKNRRSLKGIKRNEKRDQVYNIRFTAVQTNYHQLGGFGIVYYNLQPTSAPVNNNWWGNMGQPGYPRPSYGFYDGTFGTINNMYLALVTYSSALPLKSITDCMQMFAECTVRKISWTRDYGKIPTGVFETYGTGSTGTTSFTAVNQMDVPTYVTWPDENYDQPADLLTQLNTLGNTTQGVVSPGYWYPDDGASGICEQAWQRIVNAQGIKVMKPKGGKVSVSWTPKLLIPVSVNSTAAVNNIYGGVTPKKMGWISTGNTTTPTDTNALLSGPNIIFQDLNSNWSQAGTVVTPATKTIWYTTYVTYHMSFRGKVF